MPSDEALRVLQATPGYAPAYELGGPVQSLEGLDDHLARLGVDVRVLTTDSHGSRRLNVAAGWQTWRGIPVRYVRRWFPPDVAPAYLPLACVEARRAHLLHVTGVFSVPSIQALVASVVSDRPVVLSTRGALDEGALAYGPVRRKRSWLAAFGPLLHRATVFHATSRSEERAVRAALGTTVQVRVVPNGVDPPRDYRRTEPGGEPVVGFLGRIHRVKALGNLIGAAAVLRERGVRFSLLLAGPTPDNLYRRELESKIERLNLQGLVRFVGEVRGGEKRAFYEKCRVFVLPSSTENFGNVVPEALSHGVPVVASRFTPWEELEQARCGRCVDNSSGELADAIEPYLRDAALASTAGEHGRALVERAYTWNAVARSMVEVYREAIDLHRKASGSSRRPCAAR